MLNRFAVRSFLHNAAQQGEPDADQLSFTDAVNVIRPRTENPGAPPCAPETGA